MGVVDRVWSLKSIVATTSIAVVYPLPHPLSLSLSFCKCWLLRRRFIPSSFIPSNSLTSNAHVQMLNRYGSGAEQAMPMCRCLIGIGQQLDKQCPCADAY